MSVIRNCRYLHAYEDFNRKLGCTLVSNSRRPERGRHPSSRSLLSFRDRDRTERLSTDSIPRSASRPISKRLGSVKEETAVEMKSGSDDRQEHDEVNI